MPLRDHKFRSLATAIVDGELWHTVQCKPEVSSWVRQQPGENTLWFQNISDTWMINSNTFDLHPKVYTMMSLKWL